MVVAPGGVAAPKVAAPRSTDARAEAMKAHYKPAPKKVEEKVFAVDSGIE